MYKYSPARNAHGFWCLAARNAHGFCPLAARNAHSLFIFRINIQPLHLLFCVLCCVCGRGFRSYCYSRALREGVSRCSKNMALDTGSKAEPQYEPVMVVSNMFVQRMYCKKGDALLSSEWKTVALLASLVERGDFDFHAVSMPVSRWMRLLGLPIQGGRDVNRYLEHTEALEQKYCEICRVPDECSRHRWIYQQVYGQTELLSLQLNPDFLPFFCNLHPAIYRYPAVHAHAAVREIQLRPVHHPEIRACARILGDVRAHPSAAGSAAPTCGHPTSFPISYSPVLRKSPAKPIWPCPLR